MRTKPYSGVYSKVVHTVVEDQVVVKNPSVVVDCIVVVIVVVDPTLVVAHTVREL